MLFLVDEDVPRKVAEFLRSRGHQVTEVTEMPELRGKSDHVLAAIGDADGAVFVTWNAKHYKKIIRPRLKGSERLRRLGLVSFECNHALGRKRIEDVIGLIEFEYEQLQERRDSRMRIEIKKELIRILR